jgi:hypothetical protein
MPWKPELSIPGVLRLRRNLHSGYVAQLSAGIRMAPCNIPPNKRARESHTYKVHERKAQGSLSLPPLANKHHFLVLMLLLGESVEILYVEICCMDKNFDRC